MPQPCGQGASAKHVTNPRHRAGSVAALSNVGRDGETGLQAAEGCVKGLTGPRWGLLSPGKQTGWALGRRSSSWEGAVACGTPGGRHRPPCGVATAPGSSAGPSLPSCAVGAVGGLSEWFPHLWPGRQSLLLGWKCEVRGAARCTTQTCQMPEVRRPGSSPTELQPRPRFSTWQVCDGARSSSTSPRPHFPTSNTGVSDNQQSSHGCRGVERRSTGLSVPR